MAAYNPYFEKRLLDAFKKNPDHYLNLAESIVGYRWELIKKYHKIEDDLENYNLEGKDVETEVAEVNFLRGQKDAYNTAIQQLESPLKFVLDAAPMSVVYICSPYAGDTKRNIEYAQKLTRWAIVFGYVPITPHLYLPQVLEDDDERERAIGLALGLDILARCDCIMVGKEFGITAGMKAEIEHAEKLGLKRIDCEMGSSE